MTFGKFERAQPVEHFHGMTASAILVGRFDGE